MSQFWWVVPISLQAFILFLLIQVLFPFYWSDMAISSTTGCCSLYVANSPVVLTRFERAPTSKIIEIEKIPTPLGVKRGPPCVQAEHAWCSLSIPCIESLIASAIHLLWALCSLLNSKPLARCQLGLNTWRPNYVWHGIYWWLMALQGVGSIDVYVQELHMPSCQTFMRKYLNLWDIIYAIIVNS